MNFLTKENMEYLTCNFINKFSELSFGGCEVISRENLLFEAVIKINIYNKRLEFSAVEKKKQAAKDSAARQTIQFLRRNGFNPFKENFAS